MELLGFNHVHIIANRACVGVYTQRFHVFSIRVSGHMHIQKWRGVISKEKRGRATPHRKTFEANMCYVCFLDFLSGCDITMAGTSLEMARRQVSIPAKYALVFFFGGGA